MSDNLLVDAPSTGGLLLDAGPSRVGWHRHADFLRCQQLYAYKHEMHLRFEETPPLIRGSLIHIGMAHFWTRKSLAEDGPMSIELKGGKVVRLEKPSDVMEPGDAIDALAMAQPWRQQWLRWAPLAKDCLEAYAIEQAVSPDKLKVLGVEVELCCDIHGHPYSQRADLIVEENGRVYIWDHKHTAVLSEDTVDGFSVDGQFLGMFWLGRAFFGDRFGGVWANMVDIGRAGTKGRGKFTFKRFEIAPAVPLLRAFPDTVKEIRDDIERARAAGRDPMHWRKAMNQMTCVHRYGKCEAWDLCHGRKP